MKLNRIMGWVMILLVTGGRLSVLAEDKVMKSISEM
jgi:hypothetical protein